MYRLIVYEPSVSSIVEAGLERTEDTIYTHGFADTIASLVKTGLIRSVLIVSRNRNPALEKELERHGVPYRYKKVETKWYEPFISRHLVEPRIREFDREKVKSEYPYVLHREYRTLQLLYKLIHSNIPRKSGEFLYLYTKRRVPTIDFAVLLHLKYGRHVCVSSMRDTGLAFTCITSPETNAVLFNIFRKETNIIKLVQENILTGFIPTFPESPHVLHSDIMRILSEIEVRGKIALSQKIVEKFPFIEALLDTLTYDRFGKIKVRINKERIPYIENGRHEYILFQKTLTPIYSFKNGDGFTIYRIYLPLTRKIAVYTETRNPRIIVGDKPVKPEASEEVVNGYIHYLPNWAVTRINKLVSMMRTGLLAVFNKF